MSRYGPAQWLISTVLVLSGLSAACGGATPSRGGTGAPLEGPTWILTSFTAAGRVTQVAAGLHADAVFKAGTVSGVSGCNQYSGAYTTTGTSIRFGPLASTLMACASTEMELETAYQAALDRAATYHATSDGLTISDRSGGTLLSYRAGAVGALTGVTWHALSYNDGRHPAVAGVVTTIVGTEITAVFGSDGSLSGNATCNQYHATYTTKGRAVSVGHIASTRALCPDQAQQAQENAYLQALQGAASFQVQSSRLELRNSSDAIAVIYG